MRLQPGPTPGELDAYRLGIKAGQEQPGTGLAWAQRDDSWPEPSLLLCCPVCHYDYQHHGATTVFERPDGEDGPSTATTLSGTIASTDNPSPRRDAVRIDVEGECGHVWWLDLIQHKGQTFLFARFHADDQLADDASTR